MLIRLPLPRYSIFVNYYMRDITISKRILFDEQYSLYGFNHNRYVTFLSVCQM